MSNRRKRPTVALMGHFGAGNLGNEATLQAMIYNLSRYLPGAEVRCICSGPEDTSVRHKVRAFPMSGRMLKRGNGKVPQRGPLARLLRKTLVGIPAELLHWGKAVRALRGTHVLLVPGTGLLTDSYAGPFGWLYDIFKWSVIAKLWGCKVFFVSVGIGPVYRPLSRWFIKSALSMADFRCYRDAFSKRYMELINFDTSNDVVCPDLVFSLQREIMPETANGNKKPAVVGIGVKDYFGQRGTNEAIYRAYVTKLGTFVRWLLERKYTVRLLSGDFVYDGRVRRDLRELLEKWGVKYEAGQLIEEPICTVEQLLSQLAVTDIVVSPRFHNLVLALMLEKPVISLSYHEKFESLMSGLGLADYSQHIDQLDVDELIEKFIEVEKKAKDLRPYIKQKTEEYRRLLEEAYSVMFKGYLQIERRERGINA